LLWHSPAVSQEPDDDKEQAMTQTEMAFYRRHLTTLLARLSRDESQLMGEVLEPIGGEASGGLSDVPIHPADLGSPDAEQEVKLAQLETEEEIIEQVDLALVRIEQGVFGRCEGCQGNIPRRRLQALPYTPYCVDCARKEY
jgi:RNA polymerase-binding transcription factor DksA